MPSQIDYVRIPRAMFETLERRASEASVYETTLAEAGEGLGQFQITAVVTNPPSGPAAARVLTAVQKLAALARK